MDDALRCATPHSPTKAMRAHVSARLTQAHSRAEARGAPVLVRLHVTLPDCDPWALRAEVGETEVPSFLWNDGGTQLCAAAWGDLRWHALGGAAPFAQAQQHCVTWLEQVYDIAATVPSGAQAQNSNERGSCTVDAEAPLAFAAFAFDTDAQAQTPWGALAGGAVFVPARLVYRRAHVGQAHTHAVLCVPITAGSDAAQAAQKLCDAWAELFEAAQAGAPANTVVSAPSPTLRGCAAEDDATTAALWAARVHKAQADMASGSITKVVLARQRAVTAPKGRRFDARATLEALRAQHPKAVTYLVSRGDGASFLGATPEVLVRVRGRQLDTQAVAGTAPRSASPAEDAALGQALLDSAKDRHEHAVVADSLAQDLAPLCIDVARPQAPRLIRLPRLQHLETPFRGTLRHVGNVLPLCARLHPTPATGGWPRDEVRAWLAAHEPLDRGLFAGPIGWLTAGGDGTFAVALRSMLLTPGRALTFAGAGIVPASEPEAEWREIDLKLTTAQDALRLEPAKPPQAPAVPA